MDISDLDLRRRAGLPPALRVLVEAMPRITWADHPEFGGLASFWLDRHLMFRRLCDDLLGDAQARLDGDMDPEVHAKRLSRLGGMLLSHLHGHHQIEDTQFFPHMTLLDTRVSRGFDLLEADHNVMDSLLADFAKGANAVISGGPGQDPTGRFHTDLLRFQQLLDRHLTDEEEIVGRSS